MCASHQRCFLFTAPRSQQLLDFVSCGGCDGTVDIASSHDKLPSHDADTLHCICSLFGEDGHRVPILWVPSYQSPGVLNPSLVIYMHGNAESLASCHATCARRAAQLQMSYIVVEYPGYGPSTADKCDAEGVDVHLRCAYNFAVKFLHFPSGSIVLQGYSIGTGAVCRLAAELCREGCSPMAVVLMSPFVSIKQVRTLLCFQLDRTFIFDF
jgi:acetyl esterase/lipase